MNSKTDFIISRLNFKYPGITNLLSDDSISEEELKNYMNYCEMADSAVRSYHHYKTFKELKEKCKKNGIGTIIFRKDVTNITKKHFNGDRDYPDYDYLVIDTIYGSFQYPNPTSY